MCLLDCYAKLLLFKLRIEKSCFSISPLRGNLMAPLRGYHLLLQCQSPLTQPLQSSNVWNSELHMFTLSEPGTSFCKIIDFLLIL